MKKLEIGDLVLGQGMPKICIPLTGISQDEILKEAELTEQLPCQLVEWRADYLLEALKNQGDDIQRQAEKIKQVLGYLRLALDVPIIFTIRTDREGGRATLSKREYFQINQLIADSKMADFIDIETFDGPGKVEERFIRGFIAYAHGNETRVMLSSHDFEKTPDIEELLTRLFLMQELGADMMKLAVMPENEEDVYRLLEAATLMRDEYAEIPFIAISMGELGSTTRICGGEFGSVITFAAGKTASAPGQLDAVTLQQFLNQYY